MPKRKSINKELREKLYLKYVKRCAYCGQLLNYKDMQIDHFAPVYLFGDNTNIKNLKPACRSCNLYKNTFTIEKFRAQIAEIPNRLQRDSTIYKIAKRYNLICEIEEPVKFFYENLQDWMYRVSNQPKENWASSDNCLYNMFKDTLGNMFECWFEEYKNANF